MELTKSGVMAQDCCIADLEAAKSAANMQRRTGDQPLPNVTAPPGYNVTRGVPDPNPTVDSEESINFILEHINETK